MTRDGDRFFVGWSSRLPAGHAAFLGVVAAVFVALTLGLGLLLGSGAQDPDDGPVRIGERQADGGPLRPDGWQGDQVLRGHVETRGYSLLHVPASERFPQGRTLLLSGFGKRGPDLAGNNGPMQFKGGILRRGSIEMLVADDPAESAAGDASLVPPRRTPLGRWRIVGEICDGKCYPGGMRPGAGLSHRACASLCLSGDIPPILVTTAPVAGSSFLVLATDQQGSPYPALAPFIAGLVEMEGLVERVGNVLVLTVDIKTLRRL
jgi:hypothetical protein